MLPAILSVSLSLILPAIFIIGGLLIGRHNDRKHMASIIAREQQYAGMMLDNRKRVASPETVVQSTMVIGQYVAASDYFKAFATKWRSFIGGEMKSIMTLMERARREAILRMIEQAIAQGATEVWNIRLETSNISAMSGKSGSAQVELIAYGTAVTRRSV